MPISTQHTENVSAAITLYLFYGLCLQMPSEFICSWGLLGELCKAKQVIIQSEREKKPNKNNHTHGFSYKCALSKTQHCSSRSCKEKSNSPLEQQLDIGVT